jgi:hypothetical protein
VRFIKASLAFLQQLTPTTSKIITDTDSSHYHAGLADKFQDDCRHGSASIIGRSHAGHARYPKKTREIGQTFD